MVFLLILYIQSNFIVFKYYEFLCFIPESERVKQLNIPPGVPWLSLTLLMVPQVASYSVGPGKWIVYVPDGFLSYLVLQSQLWREL
jgi:hypothetical protein